MQQKVLIVDDNPANVFVLQEMLEGLYRIETATNGEEALACVARSRPDIVLLDVMMPGIDGYETCRRMRALPGLGHSKIIMVSAKAMVSERVKGYEAGADDYVVKPFDHTELLAKLRVYGRLKSVEEMDGMKSDLLRLLSHETFTPLNGVMGPLQLLREDKELSEEEREEWIETAYQSALRLGRLCEKALSLGSMRGGEWKLRPAEVDLAGLAQEAIEACAARAAERGVVVERQGVAAAPLAGDPAWLVRTIGDVLDNAIGASAEGGSVVVQVERDEHGVRVVVSDQGTGIDPQFLPRVFDAWSARDVAHHSEGHGLSLAIARHVVEAHGGAITCESTPGAGSRFTIALPQGGVALE